MSLRHESFPYFAIERDGVLSILDCETLRLAGCRVSSDLETLNALRQIDPTLDSLDSTQYGNPIFFPQNAIAGADVTPSAPAEGTALSPLLHRPGGYLHRLTLGISNACNLRCVYCYADHGQYHQTRKLLSPDRGLEFFHKFAGLYDRIGTIQFFGGEPLLNPSCIDAVCHAATRRFPDIAFSATTNGTLSTPEVLDVLQRWNIRLTISLDGPQTVHDACRPKVSGTGSYSDILASLERFNHAHIPWGVECTYNKAHQEAGISVSDLLRFFETEFGERIPHISWSYIPYSDLVATDDYGEKGIFRNALDRQATQIVPIPFLIEQFREAAKSSLDNIRAGQGGILSFVYGILSSLQGRTKARAYCPAFSSQIAVTTNGDVSPCFMFSGDPRMCIGNIDGTFPDREATERVWQHYARDFAASPTGTTRWYRNLGAGCLAGDYVSTGSFSKRLYADVYEAMIEEVILGLAQVETEEVLPLQLCHPH